MTGGQRSPLYRSRVLVVKLQAGVVAASRCCRCKQVLSLQAGVVAASSQKWIKQLGKLQAAGEAANSHSTIQLSPENILLVQCRLTIWVITPTINMMNEESQVILITGASAGIGAAAARLFGRSGYRVALAARRLELLEQIAIEIRSGGGEAFAVKADVTNLDDVQNLVRSVLEHYGQIDILFNNAGIGKLNWLENLDPREDVEGLLNANLLAPIWMAQAILPHMIQRRKGHIINMASIAGLIAPPTYSLYSSSKFGLRGFSEALRREVGIFGIKVSVIYPGGARTGFASSDVARRKTGISTPRWLVLTKDDVARAVLSLAHRPRRSLVIPWLMGFAVWMNLVFPGVIDWGIEKFFVKRERS